MKGSFENMIVYFMIFAVFILGFFPLMSGFIDDAKITADATTDIFLSMIIPFILIVFIVAFFMRLRGEKPPGSW